MTRKDSNVDHESTTEKTDYEKLTEDKEFKRFLQMKILSDSLKADSPDDLTLKQKRELVNEFNSWKKSGMPSVSMPETKQLKTHVINKIYRIKQLGEQFMFYVDGEGNHIGREERTEYALIDEISPEGKKTGKKIEDKGQILDRQWVFKMPYKKEKAEELVKQALETSLNPTFYFGKVVKNKFSEKISIEEPENFTGNFDEILKRSRKGEIV